MLRSTSHLKGTSLAATDGEIGSVQDLYFDDLTWTVRYLIVYSAGAVVRRAGEADRAGPPSSATTTLNSVFDPSHVTWVSHSGETNTLLSGHHFSALTTK